MLESNFRLSHQNENLGLKTPFYRDIDKQLLNILSFAKKTLLGPRTRKLAERSGRKHFKEVG